MNHSNTRAIASEKHLWPSGFESITRPLYDLDCVLDINQLLRLAHSRQSAGNIAVSVASFEYLTVVLNWVSAMNRVEYISYLIIAGDSRTGDALTAQGIPNIRAEIDTGKVGDNYRSPAGFSAKALGLTALKYPVVQALVRSGLNVTLSDADAVWLRVPLPYLHADVAFQRVAYFPDVVVQLWGFAACSGFVHFRCCKGALSLLERCIEEQKHVHSDQLSLNLALMEADPCWEERGRAVAPSGATREERLAEFAKTARDPLYGSLSCDNVQIEALAHHQFWRHPELPTATTDMIVCHPNTPKNQREKMRMLDRLGARFV